MPLALKTGCARPLLKKNLRPIFFFFFFFGCVYRKFCHADVDSREQQAILLKIVEILSPKLRFSSFLFFRRKNWHDFVTPFSTFANIKGSLPTNSTTPDRLRCRARPSDEDFPGFWPINFSNMKHRQKRFFFSRPASISSELLIYSLYVYPQRSP